LNPAATRLAAITGRPLVTVWPRYRLGVLSFELGTPIPATACAQRPDEASRIATQFFEKAVRLDPTTWSRIVSFLEREFARRRPEAHVGHAGVDGTRLRGVQSPLRVKSAIEQGTFRG